VTPYLWVDLRLREVDDDLPVVVVGAAAKGLRQNEPVWRDENQPNNRPLISETDKLLQPDCDRSESKSAARIFCRQWRPKAEGCGACLGEDGEGLADPVLPEVDLRDGGERQNVDRLRTAPVGSGEAGGGMTPSTWAGGFTGGLGGGATRMFVWRELLIAEW